MDTMDMDTDTDMDTAGALGTLLQSAGYTTFQDLVDANVDDYTETGPVRRLHDAVQQAKEQHPRILATSWDKFIVLGYNAIAIAKSAEPQEVPKCFECPNSKQVTRIQWSMRRGKWQWKWWRKGRRCRRPLVDDAQGVPRATVQRRLCV